MNTFPLKIGTPDGMLFDGEAERIVVRSIGGDLAVLAGHTNFCTALGMGEAHLVDAEGKTRRAACIGGLISVMNGVCRVLATTWEWQEDIDMERAAQAKARAEKLIAEGDLSDRDYMIVRARLNRALVRLSVGK